MKIEPRPYAIEAKHQVNTLLNASRSPVYLAPCGTGKTYTAAMVIADRISLKRRVFILVPQVEIFDEWMRVLAGAGLNPGYINDEGIRGKDRGVYVCMALSLVNLLPVLPESLYPDEIITDECVTGDTIIETELGPMRIDELTKYNPKYTLSYDGVAEVWNRILHFIPQGERRIIEIQTETGRKLRCTPNHLLFGDNGWQMSGTLKKGNRIFVNADAASAPAGTVTVIRQHGSKDTEYTKRKPTSNGDQSTKKYVTQRHYVPVAAGRRSNQDAEVWQDSKKCGPVADTANTSLATTSAKRIGMLNYLKVKNLVLSAHFLEIQASPSPRREAKILALHGLMDCHRRNGQSTKQHTYLHSISNCVLRKTLDMATILLSGPQAACRYCCQFMNYLFQKLASILLRHPLICSLLKVSHGGFVMTGPASMGPSAYTPKDTVMQKIKLLKVFSKTGMAHAGSPKTEEKTFITSRCIPGQQDFYYSISESMYPNVCSTKYERIIGMRDCGVQKVYDLEVEENHCYFTNGILSHNCQHALANSWEKIYSFFPKATRLGLTATLYHGSLMSFEHLYTDVVATISKSQAIAQGYITKPLLVIPAMWAQHVPKNGEDFDTEAQAEILGKPKIVGEVLSFYHRTFEGKPVIAPCSTYAHAQMMTEAFNESGWQFRHLHSLLGKHERKKILRDVAHGRINGICTVGIGIEGMSIHGLYGVLWLRRTASPIIWTQFNGRAERVLPGKEFYICADFVGNSVIHGMPDRDLSWTLEQENAEPATAKELDVPVMVRCPFCGVMNSGLNQYCHFCNSPLHAEIEDAEFDNNFPVMVDGKLVVLESDGMAREVEIRNSEIKADQQEQREIRETVTAQEIPDSDKAAVLRKGLFQGSRRKLFSDAVENWL